MSKEKRRGFTLIELIGVLVIMAILALIVTPLVMNIIRRVRIAADKRSVDAYGRSIELAIASYLLDTGKFSTEISDLTIEYSGDKVSCETTQINPDSSVYLAGCKVKNRNVEGYTYGNDKQPKAYTIGNQVTYNGVSYYVIKNSEANDSTVTLLKAEPLTVDEVNQYGGVGTENNHINMHVPSSEEYYQTAKNINNYGGMAYYSSSTCGYNGTSWADVGCKNDYESSEIKYVVDSWAADKVPSGLKEARLITSDEYSEYTVEETIETPTAPQTAYVSQYDWMYNDNYTYWTESQFEDSPIKVWLVSHAGSLVNYSIVNKNERRIKLYVVRPVIVLDKSVLTSS